jgi:pilus assembly protein CpaC
VLEVSRTKLRDLGFDIQGSFELLKPSKEGKTFLVREADAEAIDGLMDALKRNNLAKTLAEPTLVTVVGREAEFHSGGEVPVVIPQSGNSETCEFRRFGTQIRTTPRLTQDGDMKLELLIRVSELDPSLEALLNGQKIPGFRTRQINTGVEIKPGHGVVLGGLRQTRVEASRGEDGTPVERANEIETLFIVKPKLVPVATK